MKAVVLTREQLRTRREQLSRTWTSVLGAGPPAVERGLTRPAPGVLDSWRRSSAWLSPELSTAPVDVTNDAMTRWRESVMAVGLHGVEGEVRQAADDGGMVAAITDGDGVIVWSHGSRLMQRRSEQVGFVPGGRWDEASVGTNALALALRTGAPSTIYSAEHFSQAVHGWVCYAVPLTDPRTGVVRGVLDLSTTWDRAHPLAMTTASLLGRLLDAAAPPEAAVSSPRVELRVLGGWRVRVAGIDLVLPHRQIEVLALLALHPDGLSLEQLHARLYGDAPVSTATLKAEVSHLRSVLGGGIGSRPYRLTGPVGTDVQRLLDALDRGDVAGAVHGCGGVLLPGSQSPDVVEWRNYVDVALTTAVLGCADIDVVLAHADTQPYDSRVQQHLVDLLPPADPRLAAARARLARALA